MEHTVLILFCIILILVAIYMLYRYVETNRIAKLIEKKASLYTSKKSKIRNHSFFLVSSFLIFCLSVGVAAKTVDKAVLNEITMNMAEKNPKSTDYSLAQGPVAYDAAPEMIEDEGEPLDEKIAECKMLREAVLDVQVLDAVNALLSQTRDVRFEAMNAVDCIPYTFNEAAIANYLVEGQELNIYQEGDEYYVEIRQVYRLEEVAESAEETE